MHSNAFLDTLREKCTLICLTSMRMRPVINKASIEGLLLMGDFRDTGYACRIHPTVGKPIRCTFGEEQKEAVLAAMTGRVKLVGETVEINHEIKSFRIEDIEILDTEQFAGGQEFHPLLRQSN